MAINRFLLLLDRCKRWLRIRSRRVVRKAEIFCWRQLRKIDSHRYGFRIFCSIALVLIAVVSVTGYFSYDYHQVSKERYTLQLLRSAQQLEIKRQQVQINVFAQKMEMLQKRIAELEELEKRIRVQAEIEKENIAAEAFGIGGSEMVEQPEPFGIGGVSSEFSETGVGQEHLLHDLHQQASVVEAVIALKSDDLKDLLKGLEAKAAREAAIPSILPVTGGRVTSRFGYRRAPFSNRKEFHNGYDIGAPKGTPIKATADGIVQSSSYNHGFGKMITVNHGNGFLTRYAHADKLLKKRGAAIKKGETIALVGNTGRSTGPHVHYEVHKDGIPVDPTNYFETTPTKGNNNRKVAQNK